MATWTGGKTDWAAPDAIPHTELNKIGDNLDYLYSLVLSGGSYAVNNVGNIPASAEYCMAIASLSVPDAQRVVVRRATAYLSHSADLRLRIKIQVGAGGAYGATWVSAGNKIDVAPAHVAYTNDTGAAETIYPEVWAYNSGAGNTTLMYYDTFAVLLGVEPV